MVVDPSIGIQNKREELTKTFIMVSNFNKTNSALSVLMLLSLFEIIPEKCYCAQILTGSHLLGL